jgi:hypothetical protein
MLTYDWTKNGGQVTMPLETGLAINGINDKGERPVNGLPPFVVLLLNLPLAPKNTCSRSFNCKRSDVRSIREDG